MPLLMYFIYKHSYCSTSIAINYIYCTALTVILVTLEIYYIIEYGVKIDKVKKDLKKPLLKLFVVQGVH